MVDKSWMTATRFSAEYVDGVDFFIKFALDHGADPARIICPCKKCDFSKSFTSTVIRDHLICDGINADYKVWIWHGEKAPTQSNSYDAQEFQDFDSCEGDRIDDMICDVEQILIDRPDMFEEFCTDAKKPLYDGCSKFSKITAIMKLYNLKVDNGWSDKSFTVLLELLKEILPTDNCLSSSTYEAKKLLCSVGMDYQKIHACPNDCILYRKEYESFQRCPNPGCGESRYKDNGSPAKVLWYFPIKARFRRLFGNSNDAKNMTWHADGRINDGKIRHPADALQWKTIDKLHPQFGAEGRNLRIALSTDGMNPFGNMSTTHSTWPVVLAIYNMPPWLCMKRKYMMLSLLISGPNQPGNDIDVYLAPLIEDLRDMWTMGIEVFDAHRREHFRLRAMLFCTISDFPPLGNLAGYTTKGYTGCPRCHVKTDSFHLPCSKKIVYREHRRFLDDDHRYRRLCKPFNGQCCTEKAPEPLSGDEVLNIVSELNVTLGKKSGRRQEVVDGWKKRSIFFDLPYWKDLLIRHCLDVMHIEKNVCESLVGTLLNSGKSKDGINARSDYKAMNIRKELQPQQRGMRTYLPPACYTLSKQEKEVLCGFLKNIKVPDGFSSNFSNLVSMKDLKLVGMKSHDCHVLMQYLLPAAIHSILPNHVRKVISNLCFFFKKIYSSVHDRVELKQLQKDIVLILCQLEMYFPPSFFDIMVQLTVHLVREIEICGPHSFHWMYGFERNMKVYKGYVMNRTHPEACIAERYIVEEAVEFCSEYFVDVEPIGLPKSKYSSVCDWKGTLGYKAVNIDRKSWIQAHLYVLQNLEEVQPYVREHKDNLRRQNPRFGKSELWITAEHNRSFIEWFRTHIAEKTSAGDEVSSSLRLFSKGPKYQVLNYSGLVINGCTFYTKERDDKGTMQNSGVTLDAQTMHISSAKDKRPAYANMSYYGVIEHIWVLLYSSDLKIPVFNCKWVENNGGVEVDGMGFISVALDKLGYKQEPFILASQAKQVFYVPDLIKPKWSIVLFKPKRKVDEEDDNDDGFEETSSSANNLPFSPDNANQEEFYHREDHGEGIWLNETIPLEDDASSGVLHLTKRKRSVN